MVTSAMEKNTACREDREYWAGGGFQCLEWGQGRPH